MAIRKTLLPLLLITSYWAMPAWAEEPDFFPDSEKKSARNWHPLLAIGYMKGRETYFESDIFYWQGTKDNIVDRKHSEIEFATGPEIKLGVHWDVNDSFALRATAGASGDSMTYDDQTYKITSGKEKGKDLKITLTLVRYPVEAIAYYRRGSHYFGVGLNKHLGIKFDASDYPENAYNMPKRELEGDSNLGFVLEYNYIVKNNIYAALRYSYSTYNIARPVWNDKYTEINVLPKKEYDASAIGFNIGYMF